jgi:sugar lactone lactonase YvrE
MLARRANRADPGGLRDEVFALIDTVEPRRSWLGWPGATLFARRLGMALGTAATLVALVAVTVSVGLVLRYNGQPGGGFAPPASPTPPPTVSPASPTPSSTASPGSPTPPSAASACVVSTIAGKAGVTGAADGVGSAARFGEEGGSLAIGPGGVLYVSDRANRVVRKVTLDGTVTTLAGKAGEAGTADGKGSAARFGRLGGLAIDAAGAIYIADDDNNTIRKVAPDGTVTTLAGKAGEPGLVDGVGAAARFNGAVGMAIDASGNLYVGSWDVNPAIRVITPDGTVTTLAGKAGAGGTIDGVGPAASFRMPWSLAIDARGVLWVIDVASDTYHGALRKVLPDGTVTTVKTDWPSGQAGIPWVDPSGVLYFTSYPDNTITKMTPDGTVTLLAGKVGEVGSADGTGDAARFNSPTGIVGDGAGTLYVSDSSNGTIRAIRCP